MPTTFAKLAFHFAALDRIVALLPHYFMIRKAVAQCLALMALAASPGVQAQGYEVKPWPARQAVPALAGTDLQGHDWRLADLRGKAVLINFWASWCEPCLAEMPSLQALAQTYGPDKLVVLAVNFKESAPAVQRYVQRTDLNLPVLLDPAGVMAHAWGIKVFPTTVLVAANGQVRSLVRGGLDWSGPQASPLVNALLAQNNPARRPGTPR
ncbi:MAG: redoxin domain-containing protein [Comamonadaceae bacterium]|nr:MAG: redoxin domain-containing protein [Comamonadaceae bacterium]